MTDDATVYAWTFQTNTATLMGHAQGCQAAAGTRKNPFIECGTVAEMKEAHDHCRIKLCKCTKKG